MCGTNHSLELSTASIASQNSMDIELFMIFVKNVNFNSASLGWGLRFHVSDKLPGDSNDAVCRPYFDLQGCIELGFVCFLNSN